MGPRNLGNTPGSIVSCTICSFSETDRRLLPRRPTPASSAWIMQTCLSAEALSRQRETCHDYQRTGSMFEKRQSGQDCRTATSVFNQYTSRLAHLYFFRAILGVPAFLVNVHFLGDQLKFFTEKLRFVKKTEVPLGEASRLTVVSPGNLTGWNCFWSQIRILRWDHSSGRWSRMAFRSCPSVWTMFSANMIAHCTRNSALLPFQSRWSICIFSECSRSSDASYPI
jgi:hypothetical protein